MSSTKPASPTTPPKPLPTLTDQTRPFWTAAREGRFLLQRCSGCGAFQFHPKPWCVECGCRELPWTEAQPTGTVYAFTVSRSEAMNYGWQSELPVLMALVDLDDGARMYAQIINCPPEDVRIGLRVQVQCSPISDEAGIPKFHPLVAPASASKAQAGAA